jgi:hypothetical protein
VGWYSDLLNTARKGIVPDLQPGESILGRWAGGINSTLGIEQHPWVVALAQAGHAGTQTASTVERGVDFSLQAPVDAAGKALPALVPIVILLAVLIFLALVAKEAAVRKVVG